MSDDDVLISNLIERVERLERRESEMTKLFHLLDELNDVRRTELDAMSKQTDLIGDMICVHLGLPKVSQS